MESYREAPAQLPAGLPSCLREPAPRDVAAVTEYVTRARRGVYRPVVLWVFVVVAATSALAWAFSGPNGGRGGYWLPGGIAALLFVMVGSIARQTRLTAIGVLCRGEVLSGRVVRRLPGRSERAIVEGHRANGPAVHGTIPLPAWAPGGLAEGTEGAVVVAGGEVVFLAPVEQGEPVPYPGIRTVS